MNAAPITCPAPRDKVIDLYFLEHRAKLLDLAAFLDRVDRSAGEDDFRVRALRRALAVLQESEPGRVKRVLDMLSDPTTEPIAQAPGKGATGAPAP